MSLMYVIHLGILERWESDMKRRIREWEVEDGCHHITAVSRD